MEISVYWLQMLKDEALIEWLWLCCFHVLTKYTKGKNKMFFKNPLKYFRKIYFHCTVRPHSYFIIQIARVKMLTYQNQTLTWETDVCKKVSTLLAPRHDSVSSHSTATHTIEVICSVEVAPGCEWMCYYLSIYVMNWWPVQGVPCLMVQFQLGLTPAPCKSDGC